MTRNYLLIMNAKNHPEEFHVCRGTSEQKIIDEIVTERDLQPEDWAFDFYELDEFQARLASNDPEYFYFVRFA